MRERIGIVGLGRHGLPLALAFARRLPDVIGFDPDAERVTDLRRRADVRACSGLRVTNAEADLTDRTFYVVTPDQSGIPDLALLERACAVVGRSMSRGAVVVIEPTAYPGATEEVCAPILARESRLARSEFRLGYSPRRVNPGDPVHTVEKVTKVVSGEDPETLERVAGAYASIVDAGVYRATSIKVAEAAKVIENTQRDLNIALMNELAILFDRMGLRTEDVLAAAATKWNFSMFTPGLVGGDSVGVDGQYLSMKARQMGYEPEVLLAGRRINDGMGAYVAEKLIKMLIDADIKLKGARVGILGLASKANCDEARNTRVPDICRDLREYGIEAMVHDPLVAPQAASRQTGIRLTALAEMMRLDALVLAVSHQDYVGLGPALLEGRLRDGGVLVDLTSVIDPASVPPGIRYWSL